MGGFKMTSKTFSLLLLTVMVIFFGCDKITAPKPVPDNTEDANYTLIWSDEFDQVSQTPNSSNWGYDLGYGDSGWGNDEWQQYTSNAQNVKVEDGNLVISALWDSENYAAPGKRDGSVTSGRINSKNKFDVKYGNIQSRIKIPTGQGMWPAFWMLGKNYDTAGWPYCGEIDIMEASPFFHGDKTSLFTIHYWDDLLGIHNSYGTKKTLQNPLSDDYHIYEVEWDENRIVGKIDDITYYVKVLDPATMDEFRREFFLILNVAVGGSFGGSPDASTIWPQRMFVDWVRVYQKEQSLVPVETFGIYTDETPVDAGLLVGDNAEVYVWENTLTAGSAIPYEGSNVLSWTTAGVGWFGAGIQSNTPTDLSGFLEGNMKFMIKIPANVSFKIGINDAQNRESYVLFPANQTAFGLQRNGEWGQASIPISAIKGNVDLEMLSYEFIILEEAGAQCQFAIDDIYWDGGGTSPGTISFDAGSYDVSAAGATLSLSDAGAASSTVNANVSNGSQSISIAVNLGGNGTGTGYVNFGPTDDATNTLAISSGATLTATYTDSNGNILSDTAIISGGSTSGIGIYSETHTNPVLSYTQIINSADWSGNPAEPNEQSTAVTPVDGSYVLAVNFGDSGAGWGGIAFNFGAQSITAYSSLVINVNKSNMPTMSRLGIKFEDNTGGNTEVNLASYTPVISGAWARYEIPLSHFAGVNLGAVKYLGLWNPFTASNTYISGHLYFDDIYLTD